MNTVYDPYKDNFFIEKKYSQKILNWVYTNSFGKNFLPLLASKEFARLYGFYQSTPFSKSKINSFIQNFDINESDFEEKEYKSFNDFFSRKLKNPIQYFKTNNDHLQKNHIIHNVAQGRLLAYEKYDSNIKLPVKGQYLSPAKLLQNKKWSDQIQGPMVVIRLSPIDYHRFHFPFNGHILDHYTIDGKLFSVSSPGPESYPFVYIENKRQVTILNHPLIQKVAMIEVSGLCVGHIKQTFIQKGKWAKTFQAGEEKGYFLFGGSTIILLFENPNVNINPLLLNKTKEKIETFFKLGDQLATINKT